MEKGSKMEQCSTPPECRLDSLPEDILIHILSFLSFKEASKISLLARRWRFLPFRLLDFDLELTRPTGWLVDFCRSSSDLFANQVDTVISGICNHHKPNTVLRRFRICSPLDSSFSHNVESWLSFLFGKGVEALKLDFTFFTFDLMRRQCQFPSSIVQEPGSKLKLLKSLSLSGVYIDNYSLTRLLLSCELLERLCLRHLLPLTEVSITGDVSRLKYMDLSACCVSSITISAPMPYLLSLKYHTRTDHVHVEHAPLLMDLFIGQSGSSLSFLNNPLWRFASQLESLHLVIHSWEEIGNQLPLLRYLRGLKHLKLDLNGFAIKEPSLLRKNLCGLAKIINAAKSIRYLTLLANAEMYQVNIKLEFNNLDLKFLQVIEYVGFCGCDVEHELLMRITNAISPVKKLIIDCRDETRRSRSGVSSSSKANMEEWKTCALKLKEHIRADVKFELLCSCCCNRCLGHIFRL